MNMATQRTLDIQGTVDGHKRSASVKVGLVILFGWLATVLWPEGKTLSDLTPKELDETGAGASAICLICALVTAGCFFRCKGTYVYLDFKGRRIVTVDHLAWWETTRHHRPLTDFSHIVIRHLCHPGGEADDTYTGSVGLKPADAKTVLWVKSFPTTQDEVPRDTFDFATQLRESTGLPLYGKAELEHLPCGDGAFDTLSADPKVS